MLSPLVKNTEGLILTILHLEMLLLSVPVLIFNIVFLLLILTTLFQYEIGCSGAVQDSGDSQCLMTLCRHR